ncbi:amidase signature enzyme [Roridomyces roridus]|uniref:amidase n=1 Tax=Roridomyces roridus TaxID=1738132 RepID=A0AAD7CEP6_9AGAR|nr:amidase signature enzyme [Roridomyces roridus]
MSATQKTAARDHELAKEGNSSNSDRTLFLRSTAKEIVSNIESRVWTASQVLEGFIAQAVVAQSATNCVTEVLFRDARQRAKKLDLQFEQTGKVVGPLHGVPISVKDQYDIVGYDSTVGLTRRINQPAHANADYVQAMMDAGAVPFVKTNVPQTMFSYECNNPVWGRTTNPYNATYTSGGSSGGEAAILALDGAVIGLGSDIGGSLRIPASFCGIYSFKPGAERLSPYGSASSFPGMDGIRSSAGPMARCVEDLELACRVSFGVQQEPREIPQLAFREVTLPKKLRFGYHTSDGIVKASPACERAVHETVKALEREGHECVELNMDLMPEILNLYIQISSADKYSNLVKAVGSDPLVICVVLFLRVQLIMNGQDTSLALMTLVPKIPRVIRNIMAWVVRTFMGDEVMSSVLRSTGARTVEEFHGSALRRNEVRKEFYRRFWEKYELDGIITYVLASPGVVHGGTKMISIMAGNTLGYNLLNHPVGVVPVTHVDPALDALTPEWIQGPGHGSKMTEGEIYFKTTLTSNLKKPVYDATEMRGLPVGVQVVGKPWEEEKVLGMMRVVDQALGKGRGFEPGGWEARLANRGRSEGPS